MNKNVGGGCWNLAVRSTQRLDGLVSPETSRSKVALASIEPENDFRGAPLFGVRLGAQQTAGSEATRAQSSPGEILERTSSWGPCRLLRSKKKRNAPFPPESSKCK
jgi:hypothetical protein